LDFSWAFGGLWGPLRRGLYQRTRGLWTGQVVSWFVDCCFCFYGRCICNHFGHEDVLMRHGIYLASSLVFDLGLAISQMIDPLKVKNF
jgi:hypothetical protein